MMGLGRAGLGSNEEMGGTVSDPRRPRQETQRWRSGVKRLKLRSWCESLNKRVPRRTTNFNVEKLYPHFLTSRKPRLDLDLSRPLFGLTFLCKNERVVSILKENKLISCICPR